MIHRVPRGSLEYRDSSLLYDDAEVLVNPVNCIGVMGAGLAAAFARRWPAMVIDYRSACRQGLLSPGTLHVWHAPSGPTVVNVPTKRHWREMSRLDDVDAGLRALVTWLVENDATSVALPALGCGLGGLDWHVVRERIESYLLPLTDHMSIRVYRPR